MHITVLYNVFTSASSGNPSDLLADDDSVKTAQDIATALTSAGHQTKLFDVTEASLSVLPHLKTDIFFNQAFGVGNKPKSESEVTSALESYHLPFTGSGTHAIDLSNDKIKSKELFIKHNVPTASYQVITTVDELEGLTMGFPLILKLTNEHSSIGMDSSNVVFDKTQALHKAHELFTIYKRPLLVEAYIDGKELNAAILGTGDTCTVLPLSEVTFGHYFDTHPKIIDFKAKWLEGDPAYEESVGVCPAAIPDEIAKRVGDLAIAAHNLIGCTDYSRVDFRLDQAGNPFVLEVNANPGIGLLDGAIRSAKHAGFSYPSFLEKIVDLAKNRYA